MLKLQRELAYEKLRDAITYGDLKPGESLIEKEISGKFNIGRTPIREAFRQLQAERYIDVLPNKGAIVRWVSAKEIEEVYDFLCLLEGYAVELAVKKVTSSQLEELKKLKKQTMMTSEKINSEKWLINNDAFHHYFIELAGNGILEEEIGKFRRRIYRYRSLALSLQGNIKKLIDEHEFIITKAMEKKPVEAGRAMRKHISSAKGLLISFLQKNSWA